MSAIREYAICDVKDEVKALVAQGRVSRHHRIYSLCSFFCSRDWLEIERILEANDFLLRDTVLELIGREVWIND